MDFTLFIINPNCRNSYVKCAYNPIRNPKPLIHIHLGENRLHFGKPQTLIHIHLGENRLYFGKPQTLIHNTFR